MNDVIQYIMVGICLVWALYFLFATFLGNPLKKKVQKGCASKQCGC